MADSDFRAGTTSVNGTEIYYETRGQGSPVLCISGGFGDGGAWETVASLLADRHTVISYDRRGHSRSPRPEGWTSTSLDEQAADAAGLLEALGLGPAVVYANSLGGAIGLTLVLRRPDLVRLAILHEPFAASLLPDPAQADGPLREVAAPYVAAGDLRGALQALIIALNGDDGYRRIAPAQLERMLGNTETFFRVDRGNLATLTVEIAEPSVPLVITRGAESPPFLTAGARALAALLGKQLETLPGAHVPQITHPSAVAEFIGQTVSRLT